MGCCPAHLYLGRVAIAFHNSRVIVGVALTLEAAPSVREIDLRFTSGEIMGNRLAGVALLTGNNEIPLARHANI